MAVTAPPIAAPTEVGAMGVFHLKRFWSRITNDRLGRRPKGPSEGHADNLVMHALGLGTEPTIHFLYFKAPTFEEFEAWIIATAGRPEASQVARINAAIAGTDIPPETRRWLDTIDAAAPVLSADDLAFWNEHGYVILHDAISPEAQVATAAAIWEHERMQPDKPETWYPENDHGIMVQLFQHPALAANRRSARIHKAFAQVWGTADLWVSTDRVGFNPPLTPGWKFPGPDLHWDVSLHPPMPFATQGILYLTDTPAEQGAFTCVPGFQHKLDAWLKSLPPRADPRTQDLHALGSKPIAGRAGDLIIWHQALPHGSSPNRGTKPRMVHYINMYPSKLEEPAVWR